MLNTSNISEEALNDDESAESASGSAEVLPAAGELEIDQIRTGNEFNMGTDLGVILGLGIIQSGLK